MGKQTQFNRNNIKRVLFNLMADIAIDAGLSRTALKQKDVGTLSAFAVRIRNNIQRVETILSDMKLEMEIEAILSLPDDEIIDAMRRAIANDYRIIFHPLTAKWCRDNAKTLVEYMQTQYPDQVRYRPSNQ